MRHRKPISTSIKVVTANADGSVTRHTYFKGKYEQTQEYLRALDINAREYAKMSAIRLEMRLINKGLITI